MNALTALYAKVQSWMQSVKGDEGGATMVEYALMVALLAMACIGAVKTFGG